MYKFILIGLVGIGLGLYYFGALEFESDGDTIDISIDKNKAGDFKDRLGEVLED